MFFSIFYNPDISELTAETFSEFQQLICVCTGDKDKFVKQTELEIIVSKINSGERLIVLLEPDLVKMASETTGLFEETGCADAAETGFVFSIWMVPDRPDLIFGHIQIEFLDFPQGGYRVNANYLATSLRELLGPPEEVKSAIFRRSIKPSVILEWIKELNKLLRRSSQEEKGLE